MESLKNKLFKGIFLGLFLTGVVFFIGCDPVQPDIAKNTDPPKPTKATPVLDYSVVATYPHDVNSYTEGLLFHDNKLYESTAGTDYLPNTQSAIGIVDLKTGKFDKKIELDKKQFFGEGIVILKNKIYQLTWKNRTGFIYDLKTFERVGQFGYINKEGWGMTTDGEHLIFSDGGCNLTYMKPDSFKVVKTLPVIENGYGVYMLNELEYIKGFIYANVWMTNRIVKIDPSTGEVVAALDLTSLFNKVKGMDMNVNEMNGIAYEPTSDKIIVTGKLWPLMFEIDFPH